MSFLVYHIIACQNNVYVTKHSISFNANVFRKYYGIFSADTKIYPLWSDSDTLENLGKIGAGVNMGIMLFEIAIGQITCGTTGPELLVTPGTYQTIGRYPNHGTTGYTGMT